MTDNEFMAAVIATGATLLGVVATITTLAKKGAMREAEYEHLLSRIEIILEHNKQILDHLEDVLNHPNDSAFSVTAIYTRQAEILSAIAKLHCP